MVNSFIKGALGATATLLVLCLASCSPRIVERVVKETEIKIERHDSLVWRDSLIKVPIPLGKDQAITHVGDTSRLEIDVAVSEAFVDSTGLLHHKLENKQGTLDAVVKIPSRTIWTNMTNTSRETITKEVKVEKELTWWQKFRIGAFWWLLGAVAALLLWTFRKLLF